MFFYVNINLFFTLTLNVLPFTSLVHVLTDKPMAKNTQEEVEEDRK